MFSLSKTFLNVFFMASLHVLSMQITLDSLISIVSLELFFVYFLQALQYNKCVLSLIFSHKVDSLYCVLSQT